MNSSSNSSSSASGGTTSVALGEGAAAKLDKEKPAAMSNSAAALSEEADALDELEFEALEDLVDAIELGEPVDAVDVGERLEAKEDKSKASEVTTAKAKKVTQAPLRVIAAYIKCLKVGDKITAGRESAYMNDGGDGRDRAYANTYTITEKLPRNQWMTREGLKFGITPDGLWLKSLSRCSESVYQINGMEPPEDMRSKSWEYSNELRRRREEKKKDKAMMQ